MTLFGPCYINRLVLVLIGIIGPSSPTRRIWQSAFKLGQLIAKEKWAVITGGLGGVMEAAARGAKEMGGLTIGFLPGTSHHDANPYIDIAIPTGLGEMRNFLIVRAAHAIVYVGISPGTLTEMALAVRIGKPIFALELEENIPLEIAKLKNPEEAIALLRKTLEG